DVVAGDAADALAVLVVPADEVHGVGEVGAAGAAVASGALVLFPGAVHRLRVAQRGGRPGSGGDAGPGLARRPGVRAKAGFLVDEGHRHVHRQAPAFLRPLSRPVPAAVFLEYAAQVTGVARRRRGPDEDGESREAKRGKEPGQEFHAVAIADTGIFMARSVTQPLLSQRSPRWRSATAALRRSP